MRTGVPLSVVESRRGALLCGPFTHTLDTAPDLGTWFTFLDPRPAHHGKLLAAFNARLGLRLGARAPADTIDVPPHETHQDAARHRLRDAPPRAHAAPPRVEARAEG